MTATNNLWVLIRHFDRRPDQQRWPRMARPVRAGRVGRDTGDAAAGCRDLAAVTHVFGRRFARACVHPAAAHILSTGRSMPPFNRRASRLETESAINAQGCSSNEAALIGGKIKNGTRNFIGARVTAQWNLLIQHVRHIDL